MLPPKPDLSGEPRPPQAPNLYVWGGTKGKKRMINSRWGRRAIPASPSGWGPPLEWWRASLPYRLLSTFWLSLACVIFATVKDGGFGWTTTWWLWLIILGAPAFLLLIANNDRPIAAGAHWLYHKRRWIKTYEIESVRIASGLTANDLVLGQGGKELHIRVDNLQENPDLWALVYNGIRHSVANGAKITDDGGTTESTRSTLKL